MFETTELQVLTGLLKGQTLAEIGEDLSLSHPSVSKALRTIERKARLPLVERRGRRLQLTADGIRVATAAQGSLATLREIDGLITGIRTGQSGELRIIATNSMCNYLLAPVLGRLPRGDQELDMEIRGTDDEDEIWARFDAGEYEIAINRALPPPHISAQHLYDDDLCLCVAGNSSFAQEPLDWRDLAEHTLIGPLGSDQLWGQFSLLGVQPRSRIRVTSVALAKQLVEDGTAVALLYRSVAQEQASGGRIKVLALPETPLTVSYWMAIRRTAHSSPLLDRFAALMHDHVRSLVSPMQ